MPTPHDSLFKYVFSQPEHAASELRAILPAELAARIDWPTLSPVPASFVDERLAGRHADLLFTVRCAGRETFLYVLLEHQSTVDTLMAFRVLAYVVRIWERFLATHPDARRLPAVLPVVIHHGDGAWTAPTELSALIDLDAEILTALAEHVPRFRFVLDDLTDPADAPRVESFTALAAVTRFLLARTRRNPRLAEELEQQVDIFRRVLAAENGKAALAALLRYAAFVGDIAQARLQRFVQELGPAAVEAYMTTAQQLIEQGKAEGWVQGRAELLLRQMTLRFGPLPAQILDRVRTAAADRLDVWGERVLTAASLDEVLG